MGKHTVDVNPRAAASVRRHDHVVWIDAVARLKPGAKRGAAIGRLPVVELLAERDAAHRQHAGVEEAGAAKVQHHFGYATGQEDLNRRMVARVRSEVRRQCAARGG